MAEDGNVDERIERLEASVSEFENKLVGTNTRIAGVVTELNKLVGVADDWKDLDFGRDKDPRMAELIAALDRLADAEAPRVDADDPAHAQVYESAAALATALGRAPAKDGGVGNFPPGEIGLRPGNPIAPRELAAGQEATVYGWGLDEVDEVRVSDKPANILQKGDQLVRFNVPNDVRGEVEVEVDVRGETLKTALAVTEP